MLGEVMIECQCSCLNVLCGGVKVMNLEDINEDKVTEHPLWV